jgi:hypothetical protein
MEWTFITVSDIYIYNGNLFSSTGWLSRCATVDPGGEPGPFFVCGILSGHPVVRRERQSGGRVYERDSCRIIGQWSVTWDTVLEESISNHEKSTGSLR